jgi:hypothetical protein
MFRPRCPATSAPTFSSTELCALCVSAFGSLPSLCSGGSSDPCCSPIPHSFGATIPFRIVFFAHPHHLTPIESHSCKKQGRGWRIRRFHATQALPLFSTPSKHPTHRNARNSNRFMRILTILWIPGGGGETIIPGCLHQSFSTFASQVTCHGTPVTSSLRGSANSAPLRYPFSRFSTTHYPLFTTHGPPPELLPSCPQTTA